MAKLIPLLYFFLVLSSSLAEQNISISTSKFKYKLNDTIPIKLTNKSDIDLYYALGEEQFFKGRWVELEPTINQVGKIERIEKERRSTVKIIKVVLPNYCKSLIQIQSPLKIRFRVKSGIDYNEMQTGYSEPIEIILN
jgi:hypothetical protein